MGRLLQRFDRVLALGRDSYIRIYPNPGLGLCLGRWRVALSVSRGFEIFKRKAQGDWALRLRCLNRKLEKKAWGS